MLEIEEKCYGREIKCPLKTKTTTNKHNFKMNRKPFHPMVLIQWKSTPREKSTVKYMYLYQCKHQ